MKQEIISKPFEVQKYARDNNIVFDNMDDKWQRFAFRLYTMLVNLSMQAMEVEEELDGGDLKSLQKAREQSGTDKENRIRRGY